MHTEDMKNALTFVRQPFAGACRVPVLAEMYEEIVLVQADK